MMRRVIHGLSTPGGRAAAAFAALGMLVWAAHGGVLPGAFHYDDFYAFVQNPAVKTWHPIRYFTSPDAVINVYQAAGYRPLTVWSFAASYQVGGMVPSSFLLVNLVLHLAASWLVFLVGRLLLADACWAWAAGALYAIHPINAEAVNYAVARSSLLSTVFALVSVWAFIRSVERRGGAGVLVVGLTAFLAAMLSKESAVSLLVPLAAYPWLGPHTQRDAAASRPVRIAVVSYAALAALYVAFWRHMTAGGVTNWGPADHPMWTFAEMVGRSLLLWIWPWPLGLDHPLTFLTRFDQGLAAALVVGGVALVVVVAVLARRAPLAAWGVVWALAGLAPLAPLPWLTTVGLLQEQRMGFAAAGLSWMTAVLAREAWRALEGWRADRLLRWTAAGVGVVLALVAVGVDRQRSAVWNDDRRLWEEAVRRWPNNLLARMNLGTAWMNQREYTRAKAEFESVLGLVPTYSRAYYNLGLLALDQGHSEEARAAFERAVAFNAHDADAQANLGILALRAGETGTAEAAFREALRTNPTQRDALNNLAAIYLARREWASALDRVTEALRRDPTFIEASYNRGVALIGLGRRSEADPVLREVRERLPPDARFDQYRKGIDHLLAGGEP